MGRLRETSPTGDADRGSARTPCRPHSAVDGHMSGVGALLLLEMLVAAVLVLADLAASAQAKAFEFDRFGNIQQRYLCEFSPRLFRRRNPTSPPTGRRCGRGRVAPAPPTRGWPISGCQCCHQQTAVHAPGTQFRYGESGHRRSPTAAARRRPTTSRDGARPPTRPHVRCRCWPIIPRWDLIHVGTTAATRLVARLARLGWLAPCYSSGYSPSFRKRRCRWRPARHRTSAQRKNLERDTTWRRRQP